MADYAYSLRMHCAKLNLPRSEWTHYFVRGLRPEIPEYVALQQPENLEVAENYAKLKESVLSGSEKQPAIDAKQVSAQIVEELSKAGALKDKTLNALSQQGSNISKSDVQEMIRTEFQHLANRSNSNNQLISFANAEVQFFQQGDFAHVQASQFVLVVVEEAIRIIKQRENIILTNGTILSTVTSSTVASIIIYSVSAISSILARLISTVINIYTTRKYALP